MRLLYRTGDALHHGVKALLDEAEVGDVEGEVLHEPGGDGVGVGRRQKNVLLGVDAGERKIQIFQNFHLTNKTFLNLLGLVAFTLTSWLIIAMSQEFYTNTQIQIQIHLDKLAHHCGVAGDKDDPAARSWIVDDEGSGKGSDVDACIIRMQILNSGFQN